MNLLSFTVANHKSVRDAQTLDFYSGWGASKAPDDGWAAHIHPATVIMGANAAGKSNVLEALNFAISAVRLSATAWRSNTTGRHIHMPFALAEGYREQPSSYEIEFVVDDIRYVYGFEWSYKGVHKEWLSRVPNTKWTSCFERTGNSIEWNRSLVSVSSEKQLGPISNGELVLSVALRSEHDILGPIARGLTEGIEYVPVGSVAAPQRLDYLIGLIRKGALNLDELSQLMAAADTGITKVELNQQRIPESIVSQLQKIVAILQEDAAVAPELQQEGAQEAAKFNDAELQSIIRTLVTTHSGDPSRTFELSEESTGTQNWLIAAPMILTTLRTGGVLVVDEIDASLHQTLVEFVIQSFTDESINVNGAQLIFTSHNTNLLEHAHSLNLAPAGIWFAEKSVDGATELYPLSDFQLHAKANYERRYLSGRYGALPQPSPSTLRALVSPGVS